MEVKKNREFMSVALRFLKETHLLTYWKLYIFGELINRQYSKHWSDKNYIDDIFGNTAFTYFLEGELFEKYGKIEKYFTVDTKNKKSELTIFNDIKNKINRNNV